MSQPLKTVVAGLLQDKKGRFLLAQRPADKHLPFMWEFPGGKLEKDETPEEALVRELYEEIGIVTSTAALKPLTFISMAYPNFHLILLTYQCLEWSGDPYPKEGQGGLEWVSKEDLNNYPMPEANHSLIPLLKNL